MEVILKRDNGDKVKITVSIYTNGYRKVEYNVQVVIMPKNKRRWQYVHSTDDYSWRKLNAEGRKQYEMDIYLKYVSEQEIINAKILLWEQLHPNYDDKDFKREK